MRTCKLPTLFVAQWICLAVCWGCGAKDGDAPVAASIDASIPSSGSSASKTKPARDDKHPVIQVHTSHGDLTLQLDAEKAPVTVANFLDYVNSGHYDGTLIHDVEDKFIALGGGFDTSLREKPTQFAIRNEADNGLKNVRGSVAMARSPDAIDSSTAQFFFNLADNASLDHQGEESAAYGYCVFGRVTEGLDVLDRIAKAPVKAVDSFTRMPSERVTIQTVRRLK